MKAIMDGDWPHRWFHRILRLQSFKAPLSDVSIEEGVWYTIGVSIIEGVGGEFTINGTNAGISLLRTQLFLGDFGSNVVTHPVMRATNCTSLEWELDAIATTLRESSMK